MLLGFRSSFCEVWFVVELMGDTGVIGHLVSVSSGSFGEDRIEPDGRKSLIGAGFVGGGKEILLGHGEIVFGCKRRSARGVLGISRTTRGRRSRGISAMKSVVSGRVWGRAAWW